MSQLALPLRLADHAVFASFHAAGNETLVATLQSIAAGAAGPGCWLWGATATGKTHLLQAVCESAGDQSFYIPLADFADMSPEMLEGVASRSLICLDDVQAVAGRAEWERGLFTLFNQVQASAGRLVIAADSAPRSVGLELADLESRFSQLPTFQLQALGDEGARQALQLRAGHRGLDLPDETANYLLGRSRRDMASLYRLLDKLDAAALQAQRRLTVPFVRDVLQKN